MYLNDFSVRILGHKEQNQYVEIEHGEQYIVVLSNKNFVRCDADVKIDGKSVGIWRLNGQETLKIERPTNDTGRFTFYRSDSRDAEKVGVKYTNPQDRGLVTVTFTPEKLTQPSWTVSNTPYIALDNWTVSKDLSYTNPSWTSAASGDPEYAVYSANCSSGVTGLSGESNQQFVDASRLDLDYSRQTVIAIRLVAAKESADPRPLVSLSTPIPPPVK